MKNEPKINDAKNETITINKKIDMRKLNRRGSEKKRCIFVCTQNE